MKKGKKKRKSRRIMIRKGVKYRRFRGAWTPADDDLFTQ